MDLVYLVYCIGFGLILLMWDFVRADPDNIVHFAGLVAIAAASVYFALGAGLFFGDAMVAKLKSLRTFLRYGASIVGGLFANHLMYTVLFNP